jgi:hypothetical protein
MQAASVISPHANGGKHADVSEVPQLGMVVLVRRAHHAHHERVANAPASWRPEMPEFLANVPAF